MIHVRVWRGNCCLDRLVTLVAAVGWSQHISKMEHYSDGEVNFGPLIDLNTEDFCSTVKDTTMAKSPVPVGSSTPHSTGFCGIFHCVRNNISALAGSTNTQDCI